MNSHVQVQFPIRVTFEDGQSETYSSIADIELNLEDFNSSEAKHCKVEDAMGRPVLLHVSLLKLRELRLAP
jgi:hypothetical protein